MWPTRRAPPEAGWVVSIKAWCSRAANWPAANSAKARENVAGLGTAPTRLQPHSRRNVLSSFKRSTSASVSAMLNTALARKLRASAARSDLGRPTEPWAWRMKASGRASSSTVTNCR